MQDYFKNFVASISAFLPNALYALLLLVLAWIIASILRAVTQKGLRALKVDEKLSTPEDSQSGKAVVKTLSDVVYWIVFLCFIPGILGVLGLTGILFPVQNMMNSILGFLPNVLAAVLIFVIGSLIAKILRQIVSGLLSAIGANKLAEKAGLKKESGSYDIAGIVGTIVYALVLLGVLSAALTALNISAISEPINNVIGGITNAIPNIFGAALVLVISFMVGRVVAGLVESILTSINFNSLPAKLGFNSVPTEGGKTASAFVGHLTLLTIMLFAVTSAANLLGFAQLSQIIQDLTVFGGHLLTGVIIFGIGLFLANLAANLVRDSGVTNAQTLATVARVAILIFTGAMALRQMGLADDIVNLAFGLTLGALAIASAIAFGVGGIDFAKRLLSRFGSN
ncbi:MAG TPA: mechanosensitive ion channel [Pyrinomonadaceae bacterium]|nr:mechanosensitive ion channel [Pyrinomonadaceae bacterium]